MKTEAQLHDIGDIRHYVMGGNATVTLVSAKTGTRFTYQVSLKEGTDDFFFVSLLTGDDNTNDYTPCGTIRFDPRNRAWIYRVNRSALGWVTEDAHSQAGFRWFVRQINIPAGDISEQIEVWTSGKCSRCARKLTTPESVARGMGPKCRAAVASGFTGAF